MKEKYDKIGLDYNNTRKADPFLVERLVHHLAPEKRKKYLDIGCGTGNYTIALSQKGFDFVGVDPSIEMLKVANLKSHAIDWQNGKSEEIPFEDCFFDGAMATLTIHHWSSLKLGFDELFRVLTHEGKLVIFTSTPKQMEGYWLNHYFPKMLKDSMIQMPQLDIVRKYLKESGFEITSTESYFVKPDLKDLFLYAGKHNPSLYLDKRVRQGISSFSSLAHADEIIHGLNNLQKDITSGKIRDVIFNYQNENGDYLFIVAERTDKFPN